jgi:hypothetical protein
VPAKTGIGHTKKRGLSSGLASDWQQVLSPLVLDVASLVATLDCASPMIAIQRVTCEAMSDEPTPPKLAVQIDDDVAQGSYSNLVLLNHTENEFVLDFAFIQPANGRAKVRSRVISSPRHTKRLLMALQKNLERYEERYGRIELSAEEEPFVH